MKERVKKSLGVNVSHIKKLKQEAEKRVKNAYYIGVKAGQEMVNNRKPTWLEALFAILVVLASFFAGLLWR
jgi:hypothetical protein